MGVPAVLAGSDAEGVEFEGRWTSDFGLSVTTDDTYEHATSVDPTDPLVNGKLDQRIPQYQVRISPAYKFNITGDATGNIYGAFDAIGSRWSDLQNTQNLPAYETVNAGVIVNVHALTFQLAGDNLTNSHGLTEGNPRVVGTGAAATLPLSRPIFGRSATFSVAWHF